MKKNMRGSMRSQSQSQMIESSVPDPPTFLPCATMFDTGKCEHDLSGPKNSGWAKACSGSPLNMGAISL